MRAIFFGTPELAVPSLDALVGIADVVRVICQPDRPAGRGMKLRPPPVKERALELGIPVEQPTKVKTPDFAASLRALEADVALVIAYGRILPKAVLEAPRAGCVNVHASLLPRWRGAGPIQWAIASGDAETGVCLMQMEAGLDTGPVLLERRTPIGAEETGGQLHDRLAELGAQVLADGLGLLRAGIRPVPRPQPEEGVTYAHKLDKAEARLDWSRPAAELARTVRAFHPWPVAEARVAGERLRIHAATALDLDHAAAPGTLLGASREGIDIACGQGVLRLRTVQRDGGRAITAADWLNARRDLAV